MVTKIFTAKSWYETVSYTGALLLIWINLSPAIQRRKHPSALNKKQQCAGLNDCFSFFSGPMRDLFYLAVSACPYCLTITHSPKLCCKDLPPCLMRSTMKYPLLPLFPLKGQDLNQKQTWKVSVQMLARQPTQCQENPEDNCIKRQKLSQDWLKIFYVLRQQCGREFELIKLRKSKLLSSQLLLFVPSTHDRILCTILLLYLCRYIEYAKLQLLGEA